ncbi:isoaspartyl peptidase/L-asparaginase family protein [Paenibacillus sp. GP183]|uniref:isoaspartyl peptidase/L-asparaginase family protein n=1 Tax=Paenibacillus sp. GP183 TaxID=1882751 RepID=UPI00089AE564|nr:isoaspartyl peptidase/L-asparaginase family protein [Paenibacillus sp. GP183]SEC44909.1 beta-aspartyl-peptidase (threonine type) [Paenibacillus sp. GP183]
MSTIIVHGSVETSEEAPFIEGLKKGALKGYAKLTEGRLKAIEAAVNELEDNPLFNAGLGSVLNRDGFVEVDGSIMDGETGKFSAVAAMPQTRYAISVAYRLLEESDPVLLAGSGAALFAREKGIPLDNCISSEQLESWKLARSMLDEGKKLDFSLYTGIKKETDTVGCIICDDDGKLAAGSSTGGSFMKRPGRVGDTPIIGGGIYSSDQSAVVCTGKGEAFIQTLTAKFVDDQIRLGKHPQDVAEEAIKRMTRLTGETGGLIVVDALERIGISHNCNSFPVVVIVNGEVKNIINSRMISQPAVN